jgi:eukaryotic-like serine/threonine-protein kinase
VPALVATPPKQAPTTWYNRQPGAVCNAWVAMSNIPEQVGNYRLIEEIGSGASSEVWLAQHKDLDQHRVAIKLLMSQDREAVQRFNREAALASRLRHPHIVRVYDYGYIQPYYYTILEYIEGGSLKQMLKNHTRLQLAQAIAIFKQIAQALDYAHKLNIVHRDISPGNVLVEQASGLALLTDFGIAREAGRSITTTNAIMGTPDYWSPEHTHSATAVTRLSDVYSLGVVLYKMISGELPFDNAGKSPTERVFSPPIALREHDIKDVPPDLDRIFQTLLAVDPSKRYSSAGAAVADLQKLFDRHHADTVVTLGQAKPTVAQDFEAQGIEPNDVERFLGHDLIKPPLQRAHQRADELRQPMALAHLLDQWATQGSFGLRQQRLGRLARLHKSTSHNVHFYTLQVLYERRTAEETLEEPDRKAQSFPIERERGRWDIALPEPKDFENDPGAQITLPGSARVVSCGTCKGQGTTLCPRCNGKQRVYVTRPAPQTAAQAGTATGDKTANRPVAASVGAGTVAARPLNTTGTGAQPASGAAPAERVLIPCPECSGRGGIVCIRCEGEGRLVQRKAFNWKRNAQALQSNDDLPQVDEEWLRKTCKPEIIYSERQRDGLRPEWSLVPALREMIEAAQSRTDEHTRIILSEVQISFIPLTEVVFDLGESRRGKADLIRLPIYGFNNLIPNDWRLLDWQRVVATCLVAFFLIVALISSYAAFFW